MIKEYVLKHKDLPVLLFNMDDITHKVEEGNKILEKEHLPFNMQDIYNSFRIGMQTDLWLKCRGLSESRKDKLKVKELFGEKELKDLAIKSLGLNLTDHYWVHKTEVDYKWKDVNHFTNPFDVILPPENYKLELDGGVKIRSPNFCVDGSIVKRWLIKEGDRVLIKGSNFAWSQEPFNEKIVSAILDEYGLPHVQYHVRRTKDGIAYSECKCMVNKDNEYMNAFWVFNKEDYGVKELYKHYIDICERNGIKNAKENIDAMIAVDFLVGNEDRHWGNFGIIRNAHTLQWEKIADIFDNGNSFLFDYQKERLQEAGVDSLCKSFEGSNRMALQLIDYPQWWNNAGKNNIIDITSECLSKNENITPERYDAIINVTKMRIDAFEKIIKEKE